METKLGFDFDGVIADTVPLLCKIISEILKMPVSAENIDFYKLKYCSGGIIPEEVEKQIIEEVLSFERGKDLVPIHGAVQFLRVWEEITGEIIVITTREDLSPVEYFFKRHIPDLQPHLFSCDKKGELCRELGLTYFVDDCLDNAIDLANHGIFPIIFNQLYNQLNSNRSNFVQIYKRVRSWDDMFRLFIFGRTLSW